MSSNQTMRSLVRCFCNGLVLFHLLSCLPAHITEAEDESWNQSQHGVSGLSRADRDDGLLGNHSSRQACTFQGPLKARAAPLIWGQTSCLTLSLLPAGEEEEEEGGWWVRWPRLLLSFFFFLASACQKFPLLPVGKTAKYYGSKQSLEKQLGGFDLWPRK